MIRRGVSCDGRLVEQLLLFKVWRFKGFDFNRWVCILEVEVIIKVQVNFLNVLFLRRVFFSLSILHQVGIAVHGFVQFLVEITNGELFHLLFHFIDLLIHLVLEGFSILLGLFLGFLLGLLLPLLLFFLLLLSNSRVNRLILTLLDPLSIVEFLVIDFLLGPGLVHFLEVCVSHYGREPSDFFSQIQELVESLRLLLNNILLDG